MGRISDAKWRSNNPIVAALSDREKAKRYRKKNAEKISLRAKAKRLALKATQIRKPSKSRLLDFEKEQAVKLFADGNNFKQISSILNRSGQTVAKYLREIQYIRPRPIRSGPESRAWKGRVRCHGYWYVWVPEMSAYACMRDKSGRIAEHRLVLAEKLGRPLLKTETVHHINGVRNDNRSENLQLRQGHHGKHIVMACMDCGSHRLGPVAIAEICANG